MFSKILKQIGYHNTMFFSEGNQNEKAIFTSVFQKKHLIYPNNIDKMLEQY